MNNKAWTEKLLTQGIDKTVIEKAVETADLMSGKTHSKTRPLPQSGATEGFAQYLDNLSEPKT